MVMCFWPVWSVPCCCVAAESANPAGSEMAFRGSADFDSGTESCQSSECCRRFGNPDDTNGNDARHQHQAAAVGEDEPAQSGALLKSGALLNSPATMQAIDIHECLCEHGECPSSERLSYLQSWFAFSANVSSDTAPSNDPGFSIAFDDPIESDLSWISKSSLRSVSRTTPLGDFSPSKRRAVLCCWRN